MLVRAVVAVPVVLAFFTFSGCEPPKKTTSDASGTNPDSDNAASTPIVPIVPTLPVPTPSLTLEAAHQLQLAPIKRLIALFDSVQDEASAQAAAPKIVQEGRALGEGMKAFKATVAAYELSGKKAEVEAFFEQKIESREMLGETNLIGSMERLVSSPQGPLLRNEINGVLDNMLEASTSGGRRGLEHVIQQKQLRR